MVDIETGFAYEWQFLQKELLTYQIPCLLMGDFNNPVGEERVLLKLMKTNQLNIKDSYILAEQNLKKPRSRKNRWLGKQYRSTANRLYFRSDPIVKVSTYTRVFDGTNGPVVKRSFWEWLWKWNCKVRVKIEKGE